MSNVISISGHVDGSEPAPQDCSTVATLSAGQSLSELVAESEATPAWNVYQAMKTAERLLADAAAQIKLNAMMAAKCEEEAHG